MVSDKALDEVLAEVRRKFEDKPKVAFAGFGMMTHMASSNTVLQTLVRDDMRGRVMSFYSMSTMGTAPLGSLMIGAVAGIIGAPAAIGARRTRRHGRWGRHGSWHRCRTAPDRR